ncbi:DNA ligase 1-like isoform X1 [Montipora foliosa]|uniref:DNA ligase 1-like isoform X1 n=1 Tax=Montipora foliosa TaxID=591990 RepID=UPI0035F1CF73
MRLNLRKEIKGRKCGVTRSRFFGLLGNAPNLYHWIAKAGSKSGKQVLKKFGSNDQETGVFILAPTTSKPNLVERFSGESLRNATIQEVNDALTQGATSLQGFKNEWERVQIRAEQELELEQSLTSDKQKEQSFKIRKNSPSKSGDDSNEDYDVKAYREVYDWAGSIDDLPLHFTIQRRQQVVLHNDPLQGHEVLDVREGEEEEIRSILQTEVSFRGNLPQVEINKQALSDTVADGPQRRIAEEAKAGKEEREEEEKVEEIETQKRQLEETVGENEKGQENVEEKGQMEGTTEEGESIKRKNKKDKRTTAERRKEEEDVKELQATDSPQRRIAEEAKAGKEEREEEEKVEEIETQKRQLEETVGENEKGQENEEEKGQIEGTTKEGKSIKRKKKKDKRTTAERRKEEEDVKELQDDQVSFRGNIHVPQAEEEKLSDTFVDETQREKPRKKRKVKERTPERRKEKHASGETKREKGKASKKAMKISKTVKKPENQEDDCTQENKEAQDNEDAQEQVEDETEGKGDDKEQQAERRNVRKRKKDKRTGS